MTLILRRLWFISAFAMLSLLASAQDCDCPEAPDQVSWRTVKDYKDAEPLVKRSLNWLCSNGMQECGVHRESLNSYVLLWLSESPYLQVHMNTEVLPFLDDDSDLVFIMIHSMALYQLKHPKEEDPIVIHTEAIKTLLGVVKETKRYPHKKALKPFRKMNRKGELETFVRDHWKREAGL